MSRTILDTVDVKNIIKNIFAENDEQIVLTDENGVETETVSINDYLNIDFYAWKNRLESTDDGDFEVFARQLDQSLNKAIALVELTDTKVTVSQDIDSADVDGTVHFQIQANKVQNLEYYIAKIKNAYLGIPQDIQNRYGEIVKAYFLFGQLIYEQDPITTQIGETIVCTMNFTFTYLTDALTYDQLPIEMALDGGTNYYKVPYTKSTFATVFSGEVLTKQNTPNITGTVNSSVSSVFQMSMFDFNKPLMNELNTFAFGITAKKINGTTQTSKSPNKVVKLKITYNNSVYEYDFVISQITKEITNADFVVTSLSLKLYPN